MKLQYFGHSCFRIISDMGTTVVCDPYKNSYVGFDMPQVKCDLVTVSHHHNDHDCTDSIVGSYAVIDEPIAFPADDVAVDSVSTFHDEDKGSKRGKNIVFSYLVDGLKVVHMGDVGCFDDNVIRFARGCDVLLIPVGGVYTIDSATAKKYVDAIEPKIVVPMHYKVADLKFELGSLDEFLSMFNADNITKLGTTLELVDLPDNEVTKVIVLERYID